jgi:hypothetical protein
MSKILTNYELDGDGGRIIWNAEDESWEDLCLCGKTQNQEDDETGDFIDGQWYCDDCFNATIKCRDCKEPWSEGGDWFGRKWCCKKCCETPDVCEKCGLCDKSVEWVLNDTTDATLCLDCDDDKCDECECRLNFKTRSKDHLQMCKDCYDPEADKCPDISDDDDEDEDEDDEDEGQNVCFNCKDSKPANPLIKWNICLLGKCPDCESDDEDDDEDE